MPPDSSQLSRVAVVGSPDKQLGAGQTMKRLERWLDGRARVVFSELTYETSKSLQHDPRMIFVIGGDGTMSGAANFVNQGINCIGVPKTIDNDLVGTDVTFGFATAAAIATEALDRIHTTAASHHRAMVVEVMGRNAGWIALHAGVASGSDIILIPEIEFDLEAISEKVQDRSHHGKRFTIIAVAEKIPQKILEEDPKQLMWYDQAVTRSGAE